jgi:hypothetical protein
MADTEAEAIANLAVHAVQEWIEALGGSVR